jgi:glycosyltransferase involved in cell wall biosynthesis
MPEPLTLAANNPDMGGGEQMLMRCAEALLELGHPVRVVSADTTTEVLDAASSIGAEPVAIRATSRKDYLPRLRAWDRHQRTGWLWCHGLVPALATAGHRDRIVELHQVPRNLPQRAAARLATTGVRHLLVPSHDMVGSVKGSRALPNWTGEIEVVSGVVSRLAALAPQPPEEDDLAPQPPEEDDLAPQPPEEDDLAPQPPEEDDLAPQPATGKTVGYLGRLSPDKGVHVLAEAVARLDGVRLLVAGDARYVPADGARLVNDALDALGDRVVRLGHVPRAELFEQCDAVVFPSIWAEPFGLVVAEAMASGVPFVVSDAGALCEVAGPQHPWVVRADDASDLARIISEVLSTPADERDRVTKTARQRWMDEYSPTAGRQRVAKLLSEVGVR